jgi:hypothetical protein
VAPCSRAIFLSRKIPTTRWACCHFAVVSLLTHKCSFLLCIAASLRTKCPLMCRLDVIWGVGAAHHSHHSVPGALLPSMRSSLHHRFVHKQSRNVYRCENAFHCQISTSLCLVTTILLSACVFPYWRVNLHIIQAKCTFFDPTAHNRLALRAPKASLCCDTA